MQPIRFTLLAVVVALAPLAPAHGISIDYQGYAYESGGFPPSDSGDTLRIPLIVDAISADLGFNFATEELTGWVSGLVSSGTLDLGGGLQRIDYTPGRIDIFRDASRDHDFGIAPPNATVPATFTNGTACLTGRLTDFVLFIDGATSTGAYEGNVVFDAGDCLQLFRATRAEGFTFGGVFTRQAAAGGVIPAGYDLSVDGYLEATKIPSHCPLPCLAITAAKLGFPRRAPHHCGPRDGEFDIEGNFTPCATAAPFDPSVVQIRVQIGDYVQIFPPGSLRRKHHSGDDDDEIEWVYRNKHGVRSITTLEIEREDDGSWEFDIEGRGIARATLLPVGNRLDVDLVLGDMEGGQAVALQQERKRLRYRGDDDACRPPHHHHGEDVLLPPEAESALAAPSVMASPNPFNATTTITVQTTAIGAVRLRIFDVRGRLVDTLHAGYLPAGVHRFTWNGTDSAGRAVASGVYVYRLEAPALQISHKLVVAK
jgi:hypothetical protein